MVVSVAGDCRPRRRWPTPSRRRFAGGRAAGRPSGRAPVGPAEPLVVLRRPTEQAHLVLGMRSVSRFDEERWALAVLNHVLGGGLSSRLFQKVREQRGPGLLDLVRAGRLLATPASLSVAAGTAPEHVDEVLRIVTGELELLAEHGVTERELAVAKGNLRADTLLAGEDSGARMSRLGLVPAAPRRGAARSTRCWPASRRSTADEVHRAAGRLAGAPRTLAAVGPVRPRRLRRRRPGPGRPRRLRAPVAAVGAGRPPARRPSSAGPASRRWLGRHGRRPGGRRAGGRAPGRVRGAGALRPPGHRRGQRHPELPPAGPGRRAGRQGHLPLWNPYIWSGSPLLGRAQRRGRLPVHPRLRRAGPGGGLGGQPAGRLLGRRPRALRAAPPVRRCARWPACWPRLTYAFAGAMSGQIVHLGVVQGWAGCPWWCWPWCGSRGRCSGTGPRRPGDGRRAPGAARRSPWPWVALLAATSGLVVLTGEPRAMAEAEVVASVVALWLVLRPYAGWAVAVAAPGRPSSGYSVAGRPSGGWPSAAVQLRAGLVVHQRLPAGQRELRVLRCRVAAAVVDGPAARARPLRGRRHLAASRPTSTTTTCPRSPATSACCRWWRRWPSSPGALGRRRDPRAADWALWLGPGRAGPAAGLRGLHPARPPLRPHPALRQDPPAEPQPGHRRPGPGRPARLLGRPPPSGRWPGRPASGPEAVAGAGPGLGRRPCCCSWPSPSPARLEQAFGPRRPGAPLARGLTPWFLGQLVVAGGRGRAGGRVDPAVAPGPPPAPGGGGGGRRGAVHALHVGRPSNGHAPVEPTTAAATAVLGSSGPVRHLRHQRADIDDTQHRRPARPERLHQAAERRRATARSSTGPTAPPPAPTHSTPSTPAPWPRGSSPRCAWPPCSPCPTFLTQVLPAHAPGPARAPTAAPCPGAPAPGTAHRRTFWLGQPLELSGASLVRTAGDATGPLRLGVVGPTGAVTWPAETVRRTPGGWCVRVPPPADGLGGGGGRPGPGRGRHLGRSPRPPGPASASTGCCRTALSATSWGAAAGAGSGSARSHARRLLPPVWITGAPGAAARQLSAAADGGAVVAGLGPRPVTVVRSEAYISGWRWRRSRPAAGRPAPWR